MEMDGAKNPIVLVWIYYGQYPGQITCRIKEAQEALLLLDFVFHNEGVAACKGSMLRVYRCESEWQDFML